MAITFKNPLGQAFGLAIRKERERLGLQSSVLAHTIGIKLSFYNLIENGSNYLHVNKSVMVVEAFECEFDLDGVTKVLMAISMMEAVAREMLDGHQDKDLNYKRLYFDGLSAAIDKLSEHDEEKLGRLLSDFDICAFSKLTPKESAKLIEENSLDNEVLRFCRNYESYGKAPTDNTDNYILNRFNSVPSIYFDFVTDILDRLVKLPVKVGFGGLWEWEEDNKRNFQDSICFTSTVSSVVSEDNLRRYHFNYLWEQQFTNAKFIFQTNKDATQIKSDFETIFHKLLTERMKDINIAPNIKQDAADKLDTFEDAMKKIQFKSISNGDMEKELVLNQLINGNTAAWCFAFDNDNTVAFVANISSKNDSDPNKLIEGTSLNFKETKNCYDLLNALWGSLK